MLRVSFFLLLQSFGWSKRKIFSSLNCDLAAFVGPSAAFLCWPFLSRFLFFRIWAFPITVALLVAIEALNPFLLAELTGRDSS
jgi:hypothetical protein